MGHQMALQGLERATAFQADDLVVLNGPTHGNSRLLLFDHRNHRRRRRGVAQRGMHVRYQSRQFRNRHDVVADISSNNIGRQLDQEIPPALFVVSLIVILLFATACPAGRVKKAQSHSLMFDRPRPRSPPAISGSKSTPRLPASASAEVCPIAFFAPRAFETPVASGHFEKATVALDLGNLANICLVVEINDPILRLSLFVRSANS